jgi:hypothetical protein
MGEYAELYFRDEIMRKHGFDLGEGCLDSTKKPKPEKVQCPKCGKRVKPVGLSDHMRDVHTEMEG